MIRRFGEAGLLVEAGSAERAQALAAIVRGEPIAGVVAAVPGLESLLVEVDPMTADPGAIGTELERRLGGSLSFEPAARTRTIPVIYGGEMGPDLADVAALTGLAEAEVVARHAAAEVRVLVDGFAPGFAYVGELPAELRVPRLDTPRTRTSAGSVAVAGAMTGIYPAALPGGWRVIGRTPIVLFDPRRDPPVYLLPGDRVRFQPIEPAEWDARSGAPVDW